MRSFRLGAAKSWSTPDGNVSIWSAWALVLAVLAACDSAGSPGRAPGSGGNAGGIVATGGVTATGGAPAGGGAGGGPVLGHGCEGDTACSIDQEFCYHFNGAAPIGSELPRRSCVPAANWCTKAGVTGAPSCACFCDPGGADLSRCSFFNDAFDLPYAQWTTGLCTCEEREGYVFVACYG